MNLEINSLYFLIFSLIKKNLYYPFKKFYSNLYICLQTSPPKPHSFCDETLQLQSSIGFQLAIASLVTVFNHKLCFSFVIKFIVYVLYELGSIFYIFICCNFYIFICCNIELIIGIFCLLYYQKRSAFLLLSKIFCNLGSKLGLPREKINILISQFSSSKLYYKLHARNVISVLPRKITFISQICGDLFFCCTIYSRI